MLRFHRALAYSDSVRRRPAWKRIFSNDANSQTAIDNVQEIDFASFKLFCFGSETVTVMMQVGYYNASAR